jgi:hypothetical protein
MKKNALTAWCPLLLALVAGGCDSGSTTVPGEPVVLRLEGVVTSDAGGALEGPLMVRVFRPDGRGGWGEAVADVAGGYSMEIELRDGCEPGSSLEAAATIQAPDHRALDEDLGSGRAVLCTSDTQTLDHSLYREIFRTPVPVAGDLEASLTSGYRMWCAPTPEGVSCWGSGVPAPVHVSGSGDFHTVDVGVAHACALDGEGAAWCWGSNPNGALGVPGLEESEVPVQVETDVRFEALAATRESTCGLTGDGELYCWGLDGGETPQRLAEDVLFREVAGLGWHMCGIDDGGEVLCWGSNNRGEIGLPKGDSRVDEPHRIVGLQGVAAVATGLQFSCAITEGGELYCWGWNCDGQLGQNLHGIADTHEPTLVPGVPAFEQMGLGHAYSCGRTASGEVWCWGRNDRGQLGAETPSAHSSEPVQVSGEVLFQSIAGGFQSACGIATDGRIHCWGDRTDLGTGLPLEAGAHAGAGDAAWTARAVSAAALSGGGSCLF